MLYDPGLLPIVVLWVNQERNRGMHIQAKDVLSICLFSNLQFSNGVSSLISTYPLGRSYRSIDQSIELAGDDALELALNRDVWTRRETK